MIVAVVFLAAFAAFIVSAVAGGGAGLVLVPILRAILPIAAIPAALSIGTAASSASRIALFRGAIRWDMVRRFVPTALPGAALGAWLLTLFEPAYVELILGCFLLANLPALFRRKPATDSAVRTLDVRYLPAIGAVAGVLSGFTGAVGLLFNGAYQRLGLTRHEIVATRATNEILLHLLKIALYMAFGLLTNAALAAGALVAVAAILAGAATRWLLPRIDEAMFRRIGQVAMVTSGAAMFMLSSTQIMALHGAWVSHVAPGGEHELHLFWGGRRHAAIEIEPEGHVAFERPVALGSLSPAQQAAIRRIARPSEITMIEEVRGIGRPTYEVYFRRGGRPMKAELDAVQEPDRR